MAFINNVVRVSPDTYDQAFIQVCQQIELAGWTLHDTVSGTEKVYTSRGESDTEIPLYLSISYTTVIYMKLYLYWNATTHTGYCQQYYDTLSSASMSGIVQSTDKDPAIRVIGSKNFLFIQFVDMKSQDLYFSYTYSAYFAFFTPRDRLMLTTTASVTAGNDVVISVSDASQIRVGTTLQLIGINYEGTDRVSVTNVSGNNITVDTLQYDYASGAYIGTGLSMAATIVYSSGVKFCSVSNAMYNYGNIDIPSSVYNYSIAVADPINNRDPTSTTNTQILVEPNLNDVYGVGGYYADDNAFYSAPKTLADSIYCTSTDNVSISGQVTSSTSTTLTDSSKSWIVDEHSGKTMIVSGGTGINQSRVIASNTADTLTFNNSISVALDPTSIFFIVDDVYRNLMSNFTGMSAGKDTF